MKLILSLVGVGVFFGFIVIYLLGITNTQNLLLNDYNMKLKANTADFDNMWKTISQTAQVSEEAKKALMDIFTSYAEARTGKDSGNAIMKWTQESVPNADISTINRLQNIIVGAREDWTMHQKELINIAGNYNANMAVNPKGAILKLFGYQILDPKVITSTRTEKAFDSGKDDDTQLFNK